MNNPLFEIEGSAPFTVYRTGDGWTFAANTTGRAYDSAEGAATAAVGHAELALSIARSQIGIAAAADRASMYHACGSLTVVMPIGKRTAELLAGHYATPREFIVAIDAASKIGLKSAVIVEKIYDKNKNPKLVLTKNGRDILSKLAQS